MTERRRRAVVTGIGVVAPSGVGAEQHWRTVLSGQRRTGPITLFDASGYPTRLGGEVADFDPARHVDNRTLVQTDRWTHLGFAATRLALADAGLPEQAPDPYGWAVTLASSSGGNLFGQRELQRLWSSPARTVGAYQSIAWFYAASVGQLSIRHQAKGPCGVLVTESAGGLDSLAHAVRTIRRGTSVVLAGATECPLSPYALACQLRSGLLSEAADPERAYRPFDAAACGYLPAEGGAVFVVEEYGHAAARGARIYGEVAGWGATHDAVHTSATSAGDPHQYARAMRLALGPGRRRAGRGGRGGPRRARGAPLRPRRGHRAAGGLRRRGAGEHPQGVDRASAPGRVGAGRGHRPARLPARHAARVGRPGDRSRRL